jgi:hypothetical protein
MAGMGALPYGWLSTYAGKDNMDAGKQKKCRYGAGGDE